jgi:hypothetical protein
MPNPTGGVSPRRQPAQKPPHRSTPWLLLFALMAVLAVIVVIVVALFANGDMSTLARVLGAFAAVLVALAEVIRRLRK